jgi:hypothetical protein
MLFGNGPSLTTPKKGKGRRRKEKLFSCNPSLQVME